MGGRRPITTAGLGSVGTAECIGSVSPLTPRPYGLIGIFVVLISLLIVLALPRVAAAVISAEQWRELGDPAPVRISERAMLQGAA